MMQINYENGDHPDLLRKMFQTIKMFTGSVW